MWVIRVLPLFGAKPHRFTTSDGKPLTYAHVDELQRYAWHKHKQLAWGVYINERHEAQRGGAVRDVLASSAKRGQPARHYHPDSDPFA